MTNLETSSKPSLISNKIIISFLAVALIGFIDAVFLTVKYYVGSIECNLISGCQEVLNSSYSDIMGVPLALLGACFYLFVIIASLSYINNPNKLAVKSLKIVPSLGFLFSLWLVYLQIFSIRAICIYCMLSALTSTTLFIISLIMIKKTKNSALQEEEI